MSIDADTLKKTMRTWVSGVTVVTSSDGLRRAGVTASSFTSISVEPPLVLVSLQNHIETFKLIEQTNTFAISILAHNQAHLSAQFAGFVTLPDGTDKFYDVNLMTAETGAPILQDAVGWLDCRLAAIYEAGISRIVVGEVVATGHRDAILPLAYHNRGYYDLLTQE
jgi:flavin reductase (DIM6/NTAB) family NADH-FMN oxidoreductase RutF